MVDGSITNVDALGKIALIVLLFGVSAGMLLHSSREKN